MQFKPTRIPEVVLIEPQVYGDHRGFFMESWNEQTFQDAGFNMQFVQDNHSRSVQGTLRGLHYQIRKPQGKLVRIITGEVFDVAVDLRRQSPTFGQWVGEYLSEENHRTLWIPPGFAHGFYVLSEHADLTYKCTNFFAPEHERSLAWDDPDLGINWPIIADIAPVLSASDAAATAFKAAEFYE